MRIEVIYVFVLYILFLIGYLATQSIASMVEGGDWMYLMEHQIRVLATTRRISNEKIQLFIHIPMRACLNFANMNHYQRHPCCQAATNVLAIRISRGSSIFNRSFSSI